jgi:hyaluronan synthase
VRTEQWPTWSWVRKYCFRETQLFSLMFLKNTKALYKMFIRWGRSNVYENIAMAKYVFTDFKSDSKFGTRLLFVNQFLLFWWPIRFNFYVVLIVHPLLFVSSTLLNINFASFPVVFMQKNMVQLNLWAYANSILHSVCFDIALCDCNMHRSAG